MRDGQHLTRHPNYHVRWWNYISFARILHSRFNQTKPVFYCSIWNRFCLSSTREKNSLIIIKAQTTNRYEKRSKFQYSITQYNKFLGNLCTPEFDSRKNYSQFFGSLFSPVRVPANRINRQFNIAKNFTFRRVFTKGVFSIRSRVANNSAKRGKLFIVRSIHTMNNLIFRSWK